MNKYLMVVRGALHGLQVMSWHKVTDDERETAATLFGMKLSSKMNMGSGVLILNSDDELDQVKVEKHLRSLSPADFKKFIEEASYDDRTRET